MPDAIPLIYNPRAAGGRGHVLVAKATSLLKARGIRATPTPTKGPGDAGKLAKGFADDGADRILVLGGDGTLSEAANGILRAKADPALGFLPGGTGNDLLSTFGLDRMEAAASAVAVGKTRAVDAGRVTYPGGDHYFINIFGTGFISHVTALANRRLKWLGRGAYPGAVLPALARFRSSLTRLVMDDEVVEEPIGLVTVCNSERAGGGMRFAPSAVVDDGVLDVVALRDVGRRDLLQLLPKVYGGRHVDDPRVLHRRARKVEIAPATTSPLLLDGEVLGASPVTVRVLPQALNVMLSPSAE